MAVLLFFLSIFGITWLIVRYTSGTPTMSFMKEGPYIFKEEDTYTFLHMKVEKRRSWRLESSQSSEEFYNGQFAVQIANSTDSFMVRPIESPMTPDVYYEDEGPIIAVSDIEGDFEYFKNILIGNKVIDQNFNWTFGNGRLVILGDVFDRGDMVTECLWLIYKLDRESKIAGGRVHMLLGNHEMMALSGDARYCNRKYVSVSRRLGRSYKELFDASSVLGHWLRTKNSIEVIGGVLFVHAGISPSLMESDLSFQAINNIVRKELDQEFRSVANPVRPVDIVMGSLGPLWFRGYFRNDISESDIDEILAKYEVDQIVVGHTVVDKIQTLYSGKIIAIDASRKEGNGPEALLVQDGQFFKVDYQANQYQLQ